MTEDGVVSVFVRPTHCVCGTALKTIRFTVPPEDWIAEIYRCPKCDRSRSETDAEAIRKIERMPPEKTDEP